jgi:hypothetical protein
MRNAAFTHDQHDRRGCSQRRRGRVVLGEAEIVALEYSGLTLVSACGRAGTWPGTETGAQHSSALAARRRRRSARSSVAEDRRFELLRGSPTRVPTMLASVRRKPPPSVTCPDSLRAAAGERSRTRVNETRTETRPGSRTPAPAWTGCRQRASSTVRSRHHRGADQARADRRPLGWTVVSGAGRR